MLARRYTLGLYFFNSLATIANYSTLVKPYGKIISAPASIYALDLKIVSSNPMTPRASVLAQITNSPSDTYKLACLAK